jgi:hypothetical protein
MARPKPRNPSQARGRSEIDPLVCDVTGISTGAEGGWLPMTQPSPIAPVVAIDHVDTGARASADQDVTRTA